MEEGVIKGPPERVGVGRGIGRGTGYIYTDRVQ